MNELYVAHSPVPNVEIRHESARSRAVDRLLLDRRVPARGERHFE